MGDWAGVFRKVDLQLKEELNENRQPHVAV